MAIAFCADPAARWAWPDPHQFLTIFQPLVTLFGGKSFDHGSAYVVGDYFGVAQWLPPGVLPDDGPISELFERNMSEPRLGELLFLFEQMAGFHPSEPHWYIPLIGVDPALHGRGYLPMRRGFLYLVAIMDWFTRKVLAWRISNTLEADFCVEALNEAIHRFGPPEIMNTDQGSQFTSFAWTDRLKRIGTRISMDGKGRCLDNIFIERLWRSLKYECVYLHAWETGSQAKAGVGRWIAFYNHKQPHAAHGGQPPAVVYWNRIETDRQGQRVA